MPIISDNAGSEKSILGHIELPESLAKHTLPLSNVGNGAISDVLGLNAWDKGLKIARSGGSE